MLNKDISAQVLKSMECKDLSRYVFKREGIVRHEIKNGCRGHKNLLL